MFHSIRAIASHGVWLNGCCWIGLFEANSAAERLGATTDQSPLGPYQSSRAFLDKRWSSVYHSSPLRVECLPCRSRHHNARTFSKARWICSFFGHSFTVLRTATKSVSTFSEPQTTFFRCNMGHFIRHCHRLEERGWVTSKWEMAPDRNREFKYYRLTDKGRKQLVVEESQWKQMAEAVARVMWPAIEES
jgi:hypothetical protein